MRTKLGQWSHLSHYSGRRNVSAYTTARQLATVVAGLCRDPQTGADAAKVILKGQLGKLELSADDGHFQGLKLNRRTARGVRFNHAYLSRSDFSGSDMRRGRFQCADLTYCNLRNADFRGADLRECDLRFADLTRADFRGAKLNGCMLHSAQIEGATFDKGALASAVIVDRRGRRALATSKNVRVHVAAVAA